MPDTWRQVVLLLLAFVWYITALVGGATATQVISANVFLAASFVAGGQR